MWRDNTPMTDSQVTFTFHDTPVGSMLVAGRGGALTCLSFPTGHKKISPKPGWVRDDSSYAEVRRQLDAYFSGELTAFDVELELEGSDFQKAVWTALLAIPYGETVSYGEIARRIGEPLSSSRAVGTANGDNPIPVIVPCHRVIGADGSLTGFGGGLPTKRFLLDLEDRVAQKPGRQLAFFG